MSIRLIQDLHAAISRRDWTSTQIAADFIRDDIEAARKILAGTQIGSLPNDYPLSKLAADATSNVSGAPTEEEIAEALFNQRRPPHEWETAVEADPESDAGTLVSIVRDDARAVLALFASPTK